MGHFISPLNGKRREETGKAATIKLLAGASSCGRRSLDVKRFSKRGTSLPSFLYWPIDQIV